jgi:hypothetical protein
VRLGGCILVELTLAGGLLFGGGFAAERAATAVAAEIRSAGHVAGLGPAPTPRQEISEAPDPAITQEPAGTFLGMSDDVLLERVRAQPIVRFKVKTGGSSLSFRIDFADGSRAAWKPAQTNLQTSPRKEVAAYRINRLLGLNAVPPAAPRAVERDELFSRLDPDSLSFLPRIQAETVFDPSGKTAGVASYWIPVVKDSGFDKGPGLQQAQSWLTQGQSIPPDRRSLAIQLSELVVFDFLTSNPDRYTGGNMKMSPDGTRLFFMDNTMAFFTQPDGNDTTRSALLRTQRFSRRLYEALDRLDVAHIERTLAEEAESPFEILTPAEIRAVVARRDVVKRHIAELVTQYGASNVLAFP